MSRALGAALLALAAACGRGPAHEYPPEAVENFIAACRTRTSERACTCAIDRLRDRFAWEEFAAFERRMATGAVPAEVADAVRGCAGE